MALKIYTTSEIAVSLPEFVNELTGETGFAQGCAFVMATTKADAEALLRQAGLSWTQRQLCLADGMLLKKLLKASAVNRRGQIVLVHVNARGSRSPLIAWDGQGWTWIGSWDPCENEIVLPEKEG